jgi:hypothetical protein
MELLAAILVVELVVGQLVQVAQVELITAVLVQFKHQADHVL